MAGLLPEPAMLGLMEEKDFLQTAADIAGLTICHISLANGKLSLIAEIIRNSRNYQE